MKKWQKFIVILLGVMVLLKIAPVIFQMRFSTLEEQLKYAAKYRGIESTHGSLDIISPFKQYFRAVKGRAVFKRTLKKFTTELAEEGRRQDRIWILSEILNTYFAEEGVFVSIRGKGYRYAKLLEKELESWKANKEVEYQREGEDLVFTLARFYEDTGKYNDAIRVYKWIPEDFKYDKLASYSNKANLVRAYEAIGDIYGYKLNDYLSAMKAYENMAVDVRDIPENKFGVFLKEEIENSIGTPKNNPKNVNMYNKYEENFLSVKELILLSMYSRNVGFSQDKQIVLAIKTNKIEDKIKIIRSKLEFSEKYSGGIATNGCYFGGERINGVFVEEPEIWGERRDYYGYIPKKKYYIKGLSRKSSDIYQYLQPNGTYKTVTYNTPEYYEQEKIWQEKYGNVDLRKLKLKKLWN